VFAKVGQYLRKGRRHGGGRKSMENVHASRLVDGLSRNHKVNNCV
jgi:hypothetical protein